MAIISVDLENLFEAEEYVLLKLVLWVDERSKLLCKVDCLNNCDLSSFLLVFPEEVCEGTDDMVSVEGILICHSKHLIILTELR